MARLDQTRAQVAIDGLGVGERQYRLVSKYETL